MNVQDAINNISTYVMVAEMNGTEVPDILKESIAKVSNFYSDIREIRGPGHIEGGDILVTGREVLVGRSARTDAEGVFPVVLCVIAKLGDGEFGPL